jgi:DNA-binding MarR family transcriptional regulator
LIEVRPLERADLALLQKKSVGVRIKNISDSHRLVLRLKASGMSTVDIAERTGYTQTRVSLIVNNPAAQDEIARYRGEVDKAFVEETVSIVAGYHEVQRKTQRLIIDNLDRIIDKDEELNVRDLRHLLPFVADAADRLGFTKKSTVVNVNVDFAAKLEAARARSRQVQTIEHMNAAE